MSDLAQLNKDIGRIGIRDLPLDFIAGFCRRHRIHKLSLFGSVSREDFNAESDADVLIEYKANQVPGLRFVPTKRRSRGFSVATWISTHRNR